MNRTLQNCIRPVSDKSQSDLVSALRFTTRSMLGKAGSWESMLCQLCSADVPPQRSATTNARQRCCIRCRSRCSCCPPRGPPVPDIQLRYRYSYCLSPYVAQASLQGIALSPLIRGIASLRGPAAILFISRDTCSDSVAKLFGDCFQWGIAQ